MDALNWLLLVVMGLELSALGSLFGVNCVLHARTGRALDFARPRLAVVDLPRTVSEADALCRQAKHGTTLRLRVALNALDTRRTRVAVTSKPGLIYRISRQRAAELDRLAAWLVTHGGGRVVATGFGKPR
jgi:hypothetical protein